jgi:hypothetical protein
MKQATRIPITPLGYPTIRKPELADAPDLGLRGRLKHFALHLGAATQGRQSKNAAIDSPRGWLRRQLARFLGAVTNARSGTVVENHPIHTPVPPQPNHYAAPEPEPDDAPAGFDLLGWLKHFVLYLGALTVICLIGVYFFWQIPFIRDPSQILRLADDSRLVRPLASTATPAALAPPTQAMPSPPPVNNATDAPQPSSTPTDAVVATTSPPATPTDPAGALLPAASPTAVPAAGPAEPVPPTAEPVAEAAPPLTPQAEVEQLLAAAQQQMDNRRFTAPASGNALSTYRRILELQPDHPTALDGIQRITVYYQDIAQQSLQQGRLDESLAYINRGLRARPESDALLSLRRQVQQAQRAARQREQEQQQQRQAALEEMQRQQLEQIRREQLLRQQEQQPWWRQPPSNNFNESSGFNQR